MCIIIDDEISEIFFFCLVDPYPFRFIYSFFFIIILAWLLCCLLAIFVMLLLRGNCVHTAHTNAYGIILVHIKNEREKKKKEERTAVFVGVVV